MIHYTRKSDVFQPFCFAGEPLKHRTAVFSRRQRRRCGVRVLYHNAKQKNRQRYSRKRLVAQRRRCEGVYNRAAAASEIACGKEPQRRGRAVTFSPKREMSPRTIRRSRRRGRRTRLLRLFRLACLRSALRSRSCAPQHPLKTPHRGVFAPTESAPRRSSPLS